jgi:eukaryotic-like serine/threonine-protein kinase
MASEISVDTFLDLLRQSGLVSENQMLALMAEFSGEGTRPATARALADDLVKRGTLTDWQADNLLQGKHRGFFLGPHRILRPLGQGGMSRVFLAEHEMMRRRCAIKVLPTRHQADPDLLNRFRLEAFAIAQLDHPHIVRAYDFNKDVKYGKDIDYLVMEYVEGQDLRRMVEDQGPLDYRKAADYICQAAEGLAHAHAVGLVHRDVKPANLLVDPNGVLKILDLGLARVTFEGEEAWQTPEGEQSAVGTADYVAPEQVMDSRSVDGRADIYSLGYTFYYLLTGRRPFPKSTLVELLMAHRVENPEPIAKLRPDVPLELIDIIDRMTAKTPDLRFQSAKEVAERLQAWLHDSASSREYSRISALMAAAMRAKQTGAEETQPKSESSEKSEELELAFLDDDVIVSAPRTPAPARKASPAKPVEMRDKPRRPGPGDSGRTPVVPKAQADLLLDIIPDQGRVPPVVLPQFKRRESNLLMSPWLWIGLAAVVFVIILLLAILSGSGTKNVNRPTAHRSSEKAKTSEEASASHDSPAQTAAAPAAPIQQTAAPKSPETKAETPPPAAKPVEPTPSPPADAAPKPPESAPVEPKDEHQPPPAQPEKPPAEKPPAKPPDPDSLLAGLTTVSVHFTSSETDQNSLLNLIIARQAADAMKQMHIAIADNAPGVMNIDIKVSNEAESFSVTVSAELICHVPNSGDVTVWKESKSIVSLDPRRSRPDQAMKAVRPAAGKFFEQFIEAVRRARAKAKAK